MRNSQISMKSAVQFAKYVTVGLLNTAVTLVVIFLCKSILGINPYLSNAIGYICGLLNSFIWNKRWVFGQQKGKWHYQAIKFALGFALCYGLQLLVVWSLHFTSLATVEIQILSFTLSGYGIATLIGNVVYTLANFIFNKFVTFK